ncbi:hypothetical protein ACIPJG_29525 [Streptomyces halstedii]|uniref:hypothetical protein n=1 Tax=Streptomyces halstedii TaxID=1944 RepID=UPI00381FD103
MVIRLIGDARSAEETAQTLSADQLKSLLVLLICTSFGMVALAFSAAIQRARLRNIDVQAKRLEHFSGMGSDVHAVAVYRDRVEADALMKVQFEKETWERERDAWKAEETARIYQQVLSQVDRGVLGCTRCQRELWRNAG